MKSVFLLYTYLRPKSRKPRNFMLSGLFSILCMLRLFAAQLRDRHFPSDLRIDKSAMAVHRFIADRALRASVQAAETEGTLGEPEGRLPFLHHNRAVGALCGAKGTPDARIGVYREIFGSPRGAIVPIHAPRERERGNGADEIAVQAGDDITRDVLRKARRLLGDAAVLLPVAEVEDRHPRIDGAIQPRRGKAEAQRKEPRSGRGKEEKRETALPVKRQARKKRRGKGNRMSGNGRETEIGKERERKFGYGKADAGVNAAMPRTRAAAEPKSVPRTDPVRTTSGQSPVRRA